MPSDPVDGMNITITSTQEITALTVNGNTGQSIVGGATSIAAGGSQTFIYRLANTTWYSQNNSASVSFGVNMQEFLSSGTFTVPAGVTAIKVSMMGAGGAGGGATTNSRGAGGGGGAAQCVLYLTGLVPGASITVTVGTGGVGTSGTGGAGGTTSFGSYVTLTGGGGGSGNLSTATGGGSAGGISGTYNRYVAGDAGNNYDVGVRSGSGGSGSNVSGGFYFLLDGNSGSGSSACAGVNGTAASGYGAGGGGGYRIATTRSGGNGANGIVIVEW
jgi:hypothetical protein